MSVHVTRDVTILTPNEYESMVVSDQDNGILFFSRNSSKILRFRFEKIKHVSVYSKREHKVQIKFVGNHKRELKFKSSDEMENFFQAMKSMANIKKLDERCKIVQPPVRATHVKLVVQQFEALRKTNNVEMVVPKSENVPGPSEVKQVINLNEPIESITCMALVPPTPKSKLPNGIMKVWKYLTVKPKPIVSLTSVPKPLASILMASNPVVSRAQISTLEKLDPEAPNTEASKTETTPNAPQPIVPASKSLASTFPQAPSKPNIQ